MAGFNPDPNQIDLRISTDAHKLVLCRANKFFGVKIGECTCATALNLTFFLERGTYVKLGVHNAD